jgi:acetolactate synthase-1/2/3 large subunit
MVRTGSRGSVADLVAAFLEASGVENAFGVISIHNIPILGALHARRRIRFVPSRGEAGAVNMADAASRVSGRMAAVITSTGTGAGNAVGGLIEALTAGTPILHVTGQIDSPYLDRNHGYMHEVPAQLKMLKTVSKAAFRIASPDEALAVLLEARRIATTAPTGPVSIEIPIDVQRFAIDVPDDLAPPPVEAVEPDSDVLDRLADRIRSSARPLLWLGGGARNAAAHATRLADMGLGVVTSIAGRGTVPEHHVRSLGTFTQAAAVEKLYGTIDLLLVVGSHLRSNDTRNYALRLPETRIRIDVDPAAEARGYACGAFVHGDCAAVLEALADRLDKRPPAFDPSFAADLAAARDAARQELRQSLGPYVALDDALARTMPGDALWVRDITLSNSIWGNRAPALSAPRRSVYAMGGGIGQGLAMAIGAALAVPGRKVVALIGDGGFMLNLGELATAAENRADVVILLMNDGGYGVIRNIQDAHYGGARFFADFLMPSFGQIANSLDIPHWRVRDPAALSASLGAAMSVAGPAIVEIDMQAIGPFGLSFAGPPGMATGSRS